MFVKYGININKKDLKNFFNKIDENKDGSDIINFLF